MYIVHGTFHSCIAAHEVNGAVLRRLGSPPGNLKQPLETLYWAMIGYVQTKIMTIRSTGR